MKLAAPIALLCVFGLGIVFSIIGAVSLGLCTELGISEDEAGTAVGKLISALMFTSLIIILLIGPLVDKYGHKPFAIVGFLVSAACIGALAFAGSYAVALIACVILGVGGMCLNTVGNTLIPQVLFDGQNPPAALNLGNVFFGVGGLLTPLIVGLLIGGLGYGPAVTVIAVVVLLPIVLAAMGRDYPDVAVGFSAREAVRLLATGAVIAGGLALFCEIALEVCMMGFIPTYLQDVGLDQGTATTYGLPAFWLALIISRLIASRVVTPERGVAAIVAMAILAALGVGIMCVSGSPGLGWAGVIIVGLALGPNFPNIAGVTFGKYHAAVHGSAFGLIFAIGLLGGTTVPIAFGRLRDEVSVQSALLLLVGMAVAMALLALAMGAAKGTVSEAAEPEEEAPAEEEESEEASG